MTEFDASWGALLRPGRATRFFDPIPAFDPGRPDPGAVGWSGGNAWWLAELSRLVYRSRREGDGRGEPGRADLLASVGLAEGCFASAGGTQCAVVEAAGAGERYAVVAFRGTNSLRDWLTNLDALPTRWPEGGEVCRGFKAAFERVWSAIERHLEGLGDLPVFYTGHSLGAALATLAASRRPPRALYGFGSPRVGDGDFAATLAATAAFRVVHGSDLVTRLPASVGSLEFQHAGELRELTPGGAGGLGRRWLDPPRSLADHAPVNYVARLERMR